MDPAYFLSLTRNAFKQLLPLFLSFDYFYHAYSYILQARCRKKGKKREELERQYQQTRTFHLCINGLAPLPSILIRIDWKLLLKKNKKKTIDDGWSV